MITIKTGLGNKIKPTRMSPQSAFVTFPYDSDIVMAMRSMPNRVYIPEIKTWEIPAASMVMFMSKLPGYEIHVEGEYEAPAIEEVKKTLDYKFKTEPFNHQIDGVLYGINHPTFILGDMQGLGKTKQIIDLAIYRKRTEGLKHCLIVCGVNGNKYNWQDEVALHSDEQSWVLGTRFTKRTNKPFEGSSADKMYDLKHLPPHCFFIITNIETLRAMSHKEPGKKRKLVYPIAIQINELCRIGEIDMIAFDECHKAKNPESQQGEALLQTDAKYLVPMSGTPLMNNPLDLYLPLKWIGYETHSFYSFKQHYCVFGGFANQDIVGFKNLGELRAVVDEVMLRRTKDEVLDLPPKIVSVEYVEMNDGQQKIYDEVRSELRQNINKLRVLPNPLSEMIRLRQATGYPGILSTIFTESAKMDRMEEMVDEITSNGGKCVIFSNWEQITLIVKKKLARYAPAYITGVVKAEDRMAEINRFQTNPDCKVIVGTIGAMGTGITLTAASDVIFLDSPWNRALKDQAEDRAHRIGTVGTVNVRTIICKNTIDERIEDVVYRKGKMSDLLIDGRNEIVNKSAFIDLMLS